MTSPKRIAATWIALLGLAGAALATEQTLVLQQDLDGYTGVRDTFVDPQDWGTPPQYSRNYGLAEELTVTRNGRGNPLISFDLSAIPGHSMIVSATLSLYNLTPSSSGGQSLARRVRLHRVLADWDEGNQVSFPIDNPGEHGATADHSFDFYPGEGTDVPWEARGMAAGTDYAEASEGSTDVFDEGWYEWELTALVQAWVRGDVPNYGAVLRDATGYQDGNTDWRDLVSSQAPTTPLRPKLTVVFNPDTPLADAGSDQEILDWSGEAVTLDGSGSHDHPGGNDDTLEYRWSVVEHAFGSELGTELGTEQVIDFTPDTAGEWEIELEVTNEQQESSTDRVHVRLLQIQGSHPRILLTPAKIATLQSRAVPGDPRWEQLLAEADTPGGEMHAKALVANITGDPTYCDDAVTTALDVIDDPGLSSSEAGDVALVFDWCHDRVLGQDLSDFLTYFEDFVAADKASDAPGLANYWPRWSYSYAAVGLAAFGDHPEAQSWFDTYRFDRFGSVDLGLLERVSEGGGWPEGTAYDWIACLALVKTAAVWHSATGEDLFASTPWYGDRLGFLLMRRWPGLGDEWGYLFHPYASIGDTERNRGALGNLSRVMALALLERFPERPLAPQLQAYLAAPTTGSSRDFQIVWEFLWYDPELTTETPSLLTHLARGTGTLLMRSSWPDGAADTDPSATHISFQCGDHFTYHQHYDQNSFTLFKWQDLAVDSGVYSGDGLSYHDRNYEVRTIAHNTLMVYNPDEDFTHARPDASSNDGGQRTPHPASRLASDLEYLEQHEVHYERGEILRFENDTRYTYAQGDATAAYNNPAYNQAMDSPLTANVAKVSSFVRELVYLRPAAPAITDYVVLYDRVGVTDPAFSGSATKLLLHTLGEPAVTGVGTPISDGETLYTGADEAVAMWDGASLHIRALLPSDLDIRKVGGRGEKAFWVFDENYDWHWSPSEPQPRPVTEFDPIPYGEWRLEIEPSDTELEHGFLTVLHPSLEGAAMPATEVVTGAGVEGVYIDDQSLPRLALFSSAPDGAPPAGVITYPCPGDALTLNLLLDLEPSTSYELAVSSAGGQRLVELSPDPSGALSVSAEGVLAFELGADADAIFSDGFESGDTSRWSVTTR